MPYQNHIWAIYGSPPFLKLDFGLGARVAQRFLPILSPRSIFPTAQRFPVPKHVTSVPVTSLPVMWLPLVPPILLACGFPFLWQPLHQSEDKSSRPIRSQLFTHMGPMYYYWRNESTESHLTSRVPYFPYLSHTTHNINFGEWVEFLKHCTLNWAFSVWCW